LFIGYSRRVGQIKTLTERFHYRSKSMKHKRHAIAHRGGVAPTHAGSSLQRVRSGVMTGSQINATSGAGPARRSTAAASVQSPVAEVMASAQALCRSGCKQHLTVSPRWRPVVAVPVLARFACRPGSKPIARSRKIVTGCSNCSLAREGAEGGGHPEEC
jgi:hypothetical protein